MAVIDVIDVFLGSLERRKGGGGHGGGSSKSGGGGKKSGGSSSSGSSSGGSSSKGGGSSSGSGSGSSSSGNKAVDGSSSSNYFPSSHPKVSNAQAFGFGAGVGIGSNHHASSYSNGNLNRGTLRSDSPYAGREYGGANRNVVYGTSHYGSGYPYGSGGYYVDNRPLPYGFWPVPVHNYYYCQYDCYYGHEDKRPGGRTATAEIKSSISSTPETYHLIGDDQSVRAVLEALMGNCSVQDTKGTVATFDRDSLSKAVWPERVVQYYRASSFALSLDSYNNSASSPLNQPKDNNTGPAVLADTPLPTGLNMTFLACLNATIGFSVPLIEADIHRGLSKGALAGIIIGSIFGGILLLVGLILFVLHLKKKYAHRTATRSWNTNNGSRSMPLPFKNMFSFGKSGKTKEKENRGRYASIETPGGASQPESQDLAVNNVTRSEKHPDFKEMVDEPGVMAPVPLVIAGNSPFRMPEPKFS